MNIKRKLVTTALIMCVLTCGTSCFALEVKKIKNEKAQKAQRQSQSEKVLNETLNSSVIKEEYQSGSDVVHEEEISDKKGKHKKTEAPLIEGSVQKNLELEMGDCLKLALGNNPKITSALNAALASHARILESWSGFFPRFSWQTGFAKQQELSFNEEEETNAYKSYLAGSIAVSQLLYDFGVTQNEVTIKKLQYQSYKTSLTGVINDVIYNVKDSYYNLLYMIECEKVAEDTVKKYQAFYDQADAFYRIGTNPKIDVTIAEVNLSDAKLNLIQAKNNVDAAISKLNNAMGVPELGKYKVKDKLGFSPIKINFEDALELARQSRPEYRLADLKVKTANQEVKLAKKAYFPTIDAEGGYRRGGYSWYGSHGYDLGVYLNFPVVNGMLIANQVKEARALYNQEIAEAQLTRNEIHLEVHEAYLALDVKKNQIPVSQLQVKQAKENYDLSFGRYRVGVGNPIELKDAQNAYQQAQLNYYSTLYQYNSSKSNLERAIGRNIIGGEQDHIILKK